MTALLKLSQWTKETCMKSHVIAHLTIIVCNKQRALHTAAEKQITAHSTER
jgi:hypothetical protein